MMRKGEITRSPSWANATIRFAMTSFAISRPPLRSVWQAFSNAAPIARMLSGPNTESRTREKAVPTGLLRWFCLAYFAPNRCRDQPQKRPVVQSHGITLSFHREVADASRELVGPDVTDAVSFESYPRFIKGGFQDYKGLGIKRSTADSKHVPSLRSRLLGNNVLWSLPQKVVESLELTGTSGNLSKSRPSNIAGPQGTGALRSLLSPDEDGAAKCAGISKITSGCLTPMTSSFYSPPSI